MLAGLPRGRYERSTSAHCRGCDRGMPPSGHPIDGPDGDRAEASGSTVETSPDRVRRHYRRTHSGSGDQLTMNATYAVGRTDPREA